MSNTEKTFESELTISLDAQISTAHAVFKAANESLVAKLESFLSGRFKNTVANFHFDRNYISRREGNQIHVTFKNEDFFWSHDPMKFDFTLHRDGDVSFDYNHGSGGTQGDADRMEILKCFASFISHGEQLLEGIKANFDEVSEELQNWVKARNDWSKLCDELRKEKTRLEKEDFQADVEKVQKEVLIPILGNRVQNFMNQLTLEGQNKTIHFGIAEVSEYYKSFELKAVTLESYLTDSGARRFRVEMNGEERSIKRADVPELLSKMITISGEEYTANSNYEVREMLKGYAEQFKSFKDEFRSKTYKVRVDEILGENLITELSNS